MTKVTLSHAVIEI